MDSERDDGLADDVDPPLVETVDEDDGTETAGSAGTDSFASGNADPTGPVSYRDLVDLTSESRCRVIMAQNRKPSRVCGGAAGSCGRSNHNVIMRNPDRRGVTKSANPLLIHELRGPCEKNTLTILF